MAELVGQRVGNYLLTRLIGAGGFAEVYLGEHVYLRTLAAIKFLQKRLADDELETFLHEARTIAHLEHPHIVRVLDFGIEGNIPFLVMNYAPNGNLRRRYSKDLPLPTSIILPYVRQIASALQYAHNQKLIHRDIKPENMLLGQQDRLLLSDFGLAVVSQSSHEQPLLNVAGTLAYTAPEQLQGKPCFASDQYALGITIYEWLCGERPFKGPPPTLAFQHLHMLPEPLHEKNPAISLEIEQIVLKALAKDPQQRFVTTQDFATALEEAMQPEEALNPKIPIFRTETGSSKTLASVWNIPYRRNPFFTGREDVLTRLHDTLLSGKTAALTQVQVICGLGGIGKTQTAIEYAYRYQCEYQAVLWARADTPEALMTDFVAIADILHLPEKDDQYQSRIVAAIKRWLEVNTHWLLILDNVEDLSLVSDFVPHLGRDQQHVLFTTRAQFTGTLARSIDLEKMEPQEGALFLLRRAKLITPETPFQDVCHADWNNAQDIAMEMDGLPLALDQAGAYIEETACSLSDYLHRYQSRRDMLLDMRGGFVAEHPESVTSTFSLSFEKIERINPSAAELLRLCAFLHPDAIPEEIITEGAFDLIPGLQAVATDPFKLDAAISELRKFSLLRRNPDTKMLNMHRLVQAVLKDGMDENVQRLWAERAVLTVNRIFPEVEFATWQRCQRCVPHSQTCALLIKQWEMTFAEATRLLNRTGAYLMEYGQYTLAEQFHQQALAIYERALMPDHPNMANGLMNLAQLYLAQGRYPEAEPLFLRALPIYEQALGMEHHDVASCLNLLGELYYFQGKYVQTEALWKRSLSIREQVLGLDSPYVFENLNNLAVLYHYQGNYAKAELLLKHVLATDEKTIGYEHPDIAYGLDNLARLYRDTGKYAQAELLFQQALKSREQTLWLNHPLIAESLSDWARLCYLQGKYTQGELLCQRALTIWEQTLGTEHPRIAQTFNHLAMLYHAQGKCADAELLYQKTLTIRERTLGTEHPKVAHALNNLARLYCSQRKYSESEPLLLRALMIYEHVLGAEHPKVAQALNDRAILSLIQGNFSEAESLAQRAFDIRKKMLSSEHPDVAQSIHTLGKLRYSQGEHASAELFLQQALSIRKKALGAEHPDLAENLNDLARLYYIQHKYAQSEPLYQRALAISERAFEPDHPVRTLILKNYAVLLFAMKRRDDATRLYTRAKAARAKDV